uniref:BCL2 family apoptosis regulator BOK n=1 Tax=Canis lupus familiaris TaxID=9615 RepID=A0A8C0TPQ4_CANLF
MPPCARSLAGLLRIHPGLPAWHAARPVMAQTPSSAPPVHGASVCLAAPAAAPGRVEFLGEWAAGRAATHAHAARGARVWAAPGAPGEAFTPGSQRCPRPARTPPKAAPPAWGRWHGPCPRGPGCCPARLPRALSGWDELELIRPSVYRNVARQLNISLQSESVVTDAFLAVASQIFSGGITWGKVVSLYSVAAGLAVDCVRQAQPALVHALVDCLGEFVRKTLAPWLRRRGGWVRGAGGCAAAGGCWGSAARTARLPADLPSAPPSPGPAGQELPGRDRPSLPRPRAGRPHHGLRARSRPPTPAGPRAQPPQESSPLWVAAEGAGARAGAAPGTRAAASPQHRPDAAASCLPRGLCYGRQWAPRSRSRAQGRFHSQQEKELGLLLGLVGSRSHPFWGAVRHGAPQAGAAGASAAPGAGAGGCGDTGTAGFSPAGPAAASGSPSSPSSRVGLPHGDLP